MMKRKNETNTAEIVKELLEKTRPNIKQDFRICKSIGAEWAFGICEFGGGLTLTKKMVWWREGTFLPECERGRLVGSVHTHLETPYFSDTDYITSLQNDLDFMCIIYEEDGKLKLKCAELPKGRERGELLEEVSEFKELIDETFEKEEITEKDVEIVYGYAKKLESKLSISEVEI